MKIETVILLTVATLCGKGYAQGFVNLDFESANVSSYTQNGSIPTSDAIPGWTPSLTPVKYDSVSLGGSFISIWDANLNGFYPFQGNYSVALFGSTSAAASISQTGLVPIGTQSLTVDIYDSGNPGFFSVSLNGQILSMTPLETFTTPGYPYTLYGVNIPTFAGQVLPLTITALALGEPNGIILDNIQLSTTPVPEPGALGLSTLTAALLCFRRRRNSM